VDGTAHGEHCYNYNGPCCAAWNSGAKMLRTTIMMILKTPYGIGFVLAFVLNLILPEDKDEGEGPVKQGEVSTA